MCDTALMGYPVPKGSTVRASAPVCIYYTSKRGGCSNISRLLQIMHFDPTVYPEPGRFEPMRWLPEGPKELQPKNLGPDAIAYIPFGVGYTC